MKALIGLGVGIVLLVAAFNMMRGPRDSDLMKNARLTVESQLGPVEGDLREVAGLREDAVCGSASGHRFVFRAGSFHNERDLEPVTFDAIYKAWCE
jgi:hypothetical protein